MKTIKKIIDKVNTSRGAPSGRSNVDTRETISLFGKKMYITGKTYDCFVPMSDNAYDAGGAYWGIGNPIRVEYNKELTYIRFYRVGDEEAKANYEFDLQRRIEPVTKADLNFDMFLSGVKLITALKNGVYYKHRYQGYTKTAATKKFLELVNSKEGMKQFFK